ncbi:HAD family hydrolase [Bacillus cereus]
MIKAITFDLWDTIYQDEEKGDEARKKQRFRLIQAAIKEDGYSFDDEKLQEAVVIAAEKSHEIWYKKHKTPTAQERLDMITSHLNIEMDNETIKKLAVSIENVGYEISPPLFEKSKYTIDSLAKRFPLALISDTGLTSGRVLREVLKRDGLLPYFKVLTFSDEIGVSKPSEKIFHSTLEALGVNVSEALHVGDNFQKDVTGALLVGMQAIHINSHNGFKYEVGSDYSKVSGIGEVESIIKKIPILG